MAAHKNMVCVLPNDMFEHHCGKFSLSCFCFCCIHSSLEICCKFISNVASYKEVDAELYLIRYVVYIMIMITTWNEIQSNPGSSNLQGTRENGSYFDLMNVRVNEGYL